jgi:hypothetical protein
MERPVLPVVVLVEAAPFTEIPDSAIEAGCGAAFASGRGGSHFDIPLSWL